MTDPVPGKKPLPPLPRKAYDRSRGRLGLFDEIDHRMRLGQSYQPERTEGKVQGGFPDLRDLCRDTLERKKVAFVLDQASQSKRRSVARQQEPFDFDAALERATVRLTAARSCFFCHGDGLLTEHGKDSLTVCLCVRSEPDTP